MKSQINKLAYQNRVSDHPAKSLRTFLYYYTHLQPLQARMLCRTYRVTQHNHTFERLPLFSWPLKKIHEIESTTYLLSIDHPSFTGESKAGSYHEHTLNMFSDRLQDCCMLP